MKTGKETEMYNQGYMDGYNDGEKAHINPDYWTRLEHTYVGMAMQGILVNSAFDDVSVADIAITSIKLATSLIERLKEKMK